MPRCCFTEKDILSMAGKMLVACGFADSIPYVAPERRPRIKAKDGITQICNPFADTIHGRRQFDALEEFFHDYEDDPGMWMMSSSQVLAHLPKGATIRDFGLARMRWCLIELLEAEEE